MTMKATRHAKILELIQNHTVTTQEELQSLLEANGFYATQATISRDIRDLRLVKVLSPSGIYYYTQSNTAPADTLQLSGSGYYYCRIKCSFPVIRSLCAASVQWIVPVISLSSRHIPRWLPLCARQWIIAVVRRSLVPSQGRTPSLFCLRPSILPMNSAPICGNL